MTNAGNRFIYRLWAPIYDAVCGPVFEKGRRAATAAARQVGGRILEVGVGTGLSFADYDASTEIYGIDLSEPMIAKARERMASGAFPHVREVRVMDAHDLAYPDGFFDCVVAQFVITLVERPERVLEVGYDHMEGRRFRHTAQFKRWRPDRDPRSCGYDQLEEIAGYDLAEILRPDRATSAS